MSIADTTDLRTCLSTEEVLHWLQTYREKIDCTVEKIRFADSREWFFNANQSSLKHKSGKFYRITGYRGDFRGYSTVFQPLIDQRETGTQGFMIRRVGEEIQLLVQARTEPGNVGIVQIGPTIQATYSNYTAVHKGKSQPFLDRFHHPERYGATIVLDTVQPELGTKFLDKTNRNIVVESPDMADFTDPMFRWVSLHTLFELMQHDHLVNNDARLVVGMLAIELGEEILPDYSGPEAKLLLKSTQAVTNAMFDHASEAAAWVERQRVETPVEISEIPLASLPAWQITDDEIRHRDGKYFSIVHVKVHAADREVTDWDQPLITASHVGRIVLVCREIDGVLNFALAAEPQVGNTSGPLLQPTWGFDNEDDGEADAPPEIARLLDRRRAIRQYTFEGSEEGGRFYQYRNRYEIRWLPPTADVGLPRNYCWLTLGQIRELIHATDYVSDELRSVLSLFFSGACCGSAETVGGVTPELLKRGQT